jgi:hypothetical protein
MLRSAVESIAWVDVDDEAESAGEQPPARPGSRSR